MRKLAAVLFIAALIAGCGGQQETAGQANPANSTAQQQTSSASAKSYVVSRNGCTINLKKICQGFIDQPNFVYEGVQYDWNSWSQNNPAHSELRIPVNLPSGQSIGLVNCYISNQNRKAADANLIRNGEIPDQAVEEVKGKGWCEENNPDYTKMWAEIEQKVTPQ